MPTPSRIVTMLASLLCLPVLLVAFDAVRSDQANGSTASTSAVLVTAPVENEAAAEAGAQTKPDPDAERFWEAVKLLQGKKPADLAAGRAVLQTVADHEYVHAQVLLGNCLLSGSYGFPKDARKAVNLFRLAAERGNAFAKVSLGSCYASGTGIRKDESKASEWLTAALVQGADFSRPLPPPGTGGADDRGGVAGELANDPVSEAQATAHFLLGQILGRQKKPAEAQANFITAATAGVDGRSGVYAAAVQAAINYAFGNGVSRDLTKANEMLAQSRKLAGRMGVSLIHNYVSLKIVDEFATADLEESVTKAGEAYETELQFKIAATFADKKSKDYNMAEAVKWFELAADSGQVWAMLSLAFIYHQGDIRKPDPVRAFEWFEKAGGGEKPKHYLGVANLAICYLNGLGTPKDTTKAAALFTKHRDVDIVCYLGSIGQCPVMPVTLEQEVKLNETWAKQKNDPHCQYLLGLRYLGGWGVVANDGEAVRWFKKAAKANHGGALCQMGLLYEFRPRAIGQNTTQKDLEMATDCYRRASAAGNVDATANYASMLASGQGTPRDLLKAEETYQQCLKLDPRHARAHCNLGALYEQKLRNAMGTSDFLSIDTCRTLMLAEYQQSVDLNFAYAANNLGRLYYEGFLVKQDYRKAYRYFEQTVEWGLPAGHFSLGHMHEHGEGVPITFTEAAYHYRLAALEGNQEALRRLINFYLTGTGVSLDLDRATFWLQYMARLGDPRALPTICDILMKKGDYSTLVPLLRQLSELADVELAGYAHSRLAVCYAEGLGVKANSARATKYTEKAVKLGNGDAIYALAMQQMSQGKKPEAIANFERAAHTSRKASFALGQMYYFGTNVPQDKTKALKFIRQAAEMNNSDALYFLAALTFNREPGAPSLDQAIQFAQQAENSGHKQAGAIREKLERRRKEANTAPEEAARARSS